MLAWEYDHFCPWLPKSYSLTWFLTFTLPWRNDLEIHTCSLYLCRQNKNGSTGWLWTCLRWTSSWLSLLFLVWSLSFFPSIPFCSLVNSPHFKLCLLIVTLPSRVSEPDYLLWRLIPLNNNQGRKTALKLRMRILVFLKAIIFFFFHLL